MINRFEVLLKEKPHRGDLPREISLSKNELNQFS
jgi:hypothetical protein